MANQPKLPKKGQKQPGGGNFTGKPSETGRESKKQQGGHGTVRKPNRGGRS